MRLIAVTATFLGFIASGVIGVRGTVHGQTTNSQWDRVYSPPQAKRGETLYLQHFQFPTPKMHNRAAWELEVGSWALNGLTLS